MKRYIYGIFLILLIGYSCTDNQLGDYYVEYDDTETPLSSYLANHTDTFSEWISILKKADLYNAFNSSADEFTLFVPNNEAVERYYEDQGISSSEDLTETEAQNLVKYCSFNDEISESEFLQMDGTMTTPTISENYLSVSYDDDDNICIYGYKNGARVIDLGEEASNGYVFTIDSVLIPLTKTIYDQIEEDDDYSIFTEAIDATGWNDSLSVVKDTTYNDAGSTVVSSRNYTLFAVSNDVFAEAGISSLDDLISTLGASSDYTDESNELRKYVGYHVLSENYTESDLYPFDDAESDSTIIWSTEAENSVLSTNYINGSEYINYDSDSGTGISITESDIEATNGYIQKVDNYMPVYTPDQVTVIWDFCNTDDIASVVNEYGADNDLGDCFQTAQSSEYQITFSEDEVTSYTWEAYTTSSSWPTLGYLLTKIDSDTGENTYGALYDDMLVVNLGYMGNFTTSTPVLIKGTYQVTLYYACASSLSDFISGGSKCKIEVDDDSEEVYFYDGASATVGIYSLELDDVTFDTTSEHTFKLTLMDSRATTHSSYRLQLDYIKFTPVTD